MRPRRLVLALAIAAVIVGGAARTGHADPLATTQDLDAAVRHANHVITLGHGMHVEASRAPDGNPWAVTLDAAAPSPADAPAPVRPYGAEAQWYLPSWSGLTFKASCTLGVQVLATYDLRPTPTTKDSLAFGAGIRWQPGATC